MRLSVKKAGRVVLAMLTGASLSFGLTLAFSTPAQASQVECGATECSQSCQSRGFRFGKCVNGACTCY